MKIAIIGTGYVGLVTGVSLTVLGHKIFCVGRNKEKINKINKGIAPFFEVGFDSLLKNAVFSKLLIATDELESSVKNSDITFIAVGTPTVNNKIDLSHIIEVSKQVGESLRNLKSYHVVAIKSTVIPTTTEKILKSILEKYSGKKVGDFGLCMNPEFLREGYAVEDALHPDRIIIGQYDSKSGRKFAKVYSKLSCDKFFTNLRTAEMIKYASNSLFATLISYSNEIARICEETHELDVMDVWKGVHLDKRLSPVVNNKRLHPGLLSYILSGCGYGGSCFPKDTKALASYARSLNIKPQILNSTIGVNNTQPMRMVDLLKKELKELKGKRITVLGLSFKPNTDDLRESPALGIIKLLIRHGANVICHDPAVNDKGTKIELRGLKIRIAKNVGEALKNSDGVLLVTSWDQYRRLTPSIFKSKMRNVVVIDGRRIYDKNEFSDAKILYRGIGYSGT